MTRRRCHRALPAVTLPDNDDLLAEILLRLPPHPSSLPRAGLVCKRWRRLVTDPHFVRRFSAHHGGAPPLLGFFRSTTRFFISTQVEDDVPPVPDSLFSLHRWRGRTCVQDWQLLDCRHGLVLYALYGKLGKVREFMVADPMTGRRRKVLNTEPRDRVVAAAVVAASRHRFRFHLVVLFSSHFEENVSASVYSSDSGAWAHSVSALALPFPSYVIHTPSVLSSGGNAVYWLHEDGVIIRFDLARQSLAMIEQPPVAVTAAVLTRQLVRAADDGHVGFAFLSAFSVQLWEREDDSSGSAGWVLRRSIPLDRVLPLLDLKEHVNVLGITGFAEECNLIFVCTNDGVFTMHLESIKCNKVYGRPVVQYIRPYSSF